ncbi:LysR family transcriptional regulator [Bradyrhizobium sp.]|uniref:LysR family transcriptional regulator n=1 Tax=Bradyrhizobium sp. TaxID=376 RepID=UPI003C79BAA8
MLTFIRVVKSGSVTAAATRLNVSKSVISKRVSDLESTLRVELFQRSPGSVKPTEVARSFYERIVPLIRGITQATEGVSQRDRSAASYCPDIIWGLTFWGP